MKRSSSRAQLFQVLSSSYYEQKLLQSMDVQAKIYWKCTKNTIRFFLLFLCLPSKLHFQMKRSSQFKYLYWITTVLWRQISSQNSELPFLHGKIIWMATLLKELFAIQVGKFSDFGKSNEGFSREKLLSSWNFNDHFSFVESKGFSAHHKKKRKKETNGRNSIQVYQYLLHSWVICENGL